LNSLNVVGTLVACRRRFYFLSFFYVVFSWFVFDFVFVVVVFTSVGGGGYVVFV